MESARALLDAARAERDLHAGSMNAEPRVALDEAKERVQSARAQAEDLRQQITSLGAPEPAAPASTRSPQSADEALVLATADMKLKAAAREQAARERVEAEPR